MPLSRTYASLDLSLDIGFDDCRKHSGPTNSLPPTFQPGHGCFPPLPPLRLLTGSLPNTGTQCCTPLNVQNSPAEPVEPSPPPSLVGSLPVLVDQGPRRSLHPARPLIPRSKPKHDLYRQVLISYLKKTAKGRALYHGTRKSAIITVNSRTESKWMTATHMPKMSIFPIKQSAV